jgi:hypothetical protein
MTTPTLDFAPAGGSMLRFLMAATVATAIMFAACGGGKSDAKPSPIDPTAAAAASAQAANPGLQQPVADEKVQPTPTKAPDTAIAVSVIAGKQMYSPTLADFRGLPSAKIDAAGQSYSGVTIATLASKVSAGDGTTVTIQGTRADGKRTGLLRYALADIGSGTILTLDDGGHVALMSNTVDKSMWLIYVTSVAFQ